MSSHRPPSPLPAITSRAAEVAPRQNKRRIRPELRPLETRDATGSVVGGVVAAALGSGITNPLDRLAALTGDWALSPDGPAVGSGASTSESQAVTKAGKPVSAWLPPQLELDSLDLTPRPTRAAQSNAAVPQADTDRIESRRLGRLEDIGISPAASAIHMAAPSQPPPASAPPSLQAPVSPSDATGAGHAPTGWGTAIASTNATPAAPIGIRGGFESIPDDPPSNQAPVATDDTITTDEDTPVGIDVLANDSDPDGDTLTIDDWDDPAGGSVTLESDGTLKYTPNPDYENTSSGYAQPDTFTYTVTDGLAESTATVSVTVNSVNDPPAAFNDALSGSSSAYSLSPVPPGYTAIPIYVLANDTDYDGSGLTVGSLDADSSVRISADQTFVEWVVPLDYTGSIQFSY